MTSFHITDTAIICYYVVHDEFRKFGGSYETFASYFNTKMSSQHMHDSTTSNRCAPIGTRGVAALISESRSEYRKRFCAGVIAKADGILREIVQDPGWNCIFNKVEEGSQEVKTSHTYAGLRSNSLT